MKHKEMHAKIKDIHLTIKSCNIIHDYHLLFQTNQIRMRHLIRKYPLFVQTLLDMH